MWSRRCMAATGSRSMCAAERAPDRVPMAVVAPKLISQPLATWEREGLVATLHKAGLPIEGVTEPGLLFWRFQTIDDVPVGFGGLEVHGTHAVLRSIVTLPPLRRRGIGAAIVAAVEGEAALLKA